MMKSQLVLLASRIILLTYFASIISYCLIYRKQAKKIFTNFFLADTSAFNLAIFRIVLFSLLFVQIRHPESTCFYATLPQELIFPPLGSQWLIELVPFDPQILRTIYPIFQLFCFTAIIGWMTRFSAWMVVILGIYILVIPESFGKVNHGHDILWFAMILAASRCGDVLSVDGIIKAFHKADRKDTDPPRPSIQYALPLRFVWLLYGIIYFFPGFWKVWNAGFGWALGDNLKYQMYQLWYEKSWIPAFRIDLYPWLYKLSGLATLAFELSFIILIFFPSLRMLAVLGGIAFHFLVFTFMKIFFQQLLVCYVVFVDWQKFFCTLGKKMFSKGLFLIFDGNCRVHRRAVAVLRTFDVVEGICYVNFSQERALNSFRLDWLKSEELSKSVHVVKGQTIYRGFYAYRALASRIPFLWPILPLLFLWPPQNGKPIEHVADSRGHRVKPVLLSERPSIIKMPVCWVGGALLLTNVLFGFKGAIDAWPFSCYPTFAYRASDKVLSLVIIATDRHGKEILVDEHSLHSYFATDRIRGMFQKILSIKDFDTRNQKLQALVKFLTENNASVKQADIIKFYRVGYKIEPGKNLKEPLSKELMLEVKL